MTVLFVQNGVDTVYSGQVAELEEKVKTLEVGNDLLKKELNRR